MLIIRKSNIKNIQRNLREILSQFGVPEQTSIFIKPNWGGRFPILKGENTDPIFLEILIKILIEKRNKIIVGHTSLLKIEEGDYSFENLIHINTTKQLRKNRNVHFVNLDKEARISVHESGLDIELPVIFEKIGFYINLAKLKTHMETKVSLCMKNQVGLLSSTDRIYMHQTDLDSVIALLAKKIRPDLCIIDGIVAMEEEGPHHGKPNKANMIVASDDILEVDAITSYLMGFNPVDIAHIKIAATMNVGTIPDSNILKKYESLKIKRFKHASECLKKFGLTIWPTKACSRCIFALSNVKSTLLRRPIIALSIYGKSEKNNIVIGNGRFDLANRAPVIFIGNCTKQSAFNNNCDYLEGCPPTSIDMFNFIATKILRK